MKVFNPLGRNCRRTALVSTTMTSAALTLLRCFHHAGFTWLPRLEGEKRRVPSVLGASGIFLDRRKPQGPGLLPRRSIEIESQVGHEFLDSRDGLSCLYVLEGNFSATWRGAALSPRIWQLAHSVAAR